MNKKASVRKLLGLTQQELATILNVSRSNFSLFELGTRSLPVEPTQLLAEMLNYVQTPQRTVRTVPKCPEEQAKMRAYLERLLAENNYQRAVVEKELATANAKHDAQLRVLQVVEFLNSRAQEKNAVNALLYQAIERRATPAAEAADLHEVILLEIKREMLLVENTVIQSKLLRFTWYPNNTEIL